MNFDGILIVLHALLSAGNKLPQLTSLAGIPLSERISPSYAINMRKLTDVSSAYYNEALVEYFQGFRRRFCSAAGGILP